MDTSPSSSLLTPRWTRMHYHEPQHRLWTSGTRFKLVEAPRRSGKTESALRDGVLCLIAGHQDYRVLFAAPTRQHARDIFWNELKNLIPEWMIARINESEMEIRLVHGPRARVFGMEEPRRIEGQPWDKAYFDEMAEMREGVFDRHIRGALSTGGREGSAWFFGVPRIGHVAGGGKEFKKLSDLARSGKDPEWEYFHWTSEGIVSEKEIASARATMDPNIFAQEYEARRVSLTGHAYYSFERQVHARESLPYKPKAPLIFMFDFNVEPGPAVVGQDQRFRERPSERQDRPEVADEITAIIGQVHIPKDSNTPSVCRKLIADWGPPGPDNPQGRDHQGPVWCYGDPSGGSRHTNTDDENGTDWTVIRSYLKPVFGDRLSIRGPGTERSERKRINALNARLKTADGKVHLLIDPVAAPTVVEDFEETTIKPGSDGEIHKPSGTPYSHWTEAIGFFCVRAHPITGSTVRSDAFR